MGRTDLAMLIARLITGKFFFNVCKLASLILFKTVDERCRRVWDGLLGGRLVGISGRISGSGAALAPMPTAEKCACQPVTLSDLSLLRLGPSPALFLVAGKHLDD